MPDIVEDGDIVAVLGGGEANISDLDWAMTRADKLICADSGGLRALEWGRRPDLVVGDFDSSSSAIFEKQGIATRKVLDQNRTDFQKCLAATRARCILAVGFLGRRLDHQLASLSAISAEPAGRVLLISQHDVAFLAPPYLEMEYLGGGGASFYPLTAVNARSEGLRWNLDGIDLRPTGMIGTSNRVVGDQFTLTVDTGHLIVILPRWRAETVRCALHR